MGRDIGREHMIVHSVCELALPKQCTSKVHRLEECRRMGKAWGKGAFQWNCVPRPSPKMTAIACAIRKSLLTLLLVLRPMRNTVPTADIKANRRTSVCAFSALPSYTSYIRVLHLEDTVYFHTPQTTKRGRLVCSSSLGITPITFAELNSSTPSPHRRTNAENTQIAGESSRPTKR